VFLSGRTDAHRRDPGQPDARLPDATPGGDAFDH